MYTVGGRLVPVVDAQVHIWDASPHNQAAPAGESYAIHLLRRHRELDGAGVPPHEVERVSERSLNRDVFGDGYVDRAVLQPVVLGELFVLGFSPLEWHAEMAGWMPDRFVLSGELDPGGGQPGARGLTPRVRRFDLRGITLCERGRPAGRLALGDPWLRTVLARCAAAGADVVHIGVGPSTRQAPWRHAEPPGAPVRVRPPVVPRWAEPVRAGAARPVRASAEARVAPPGFDTGEFCELAAALPQVRFVLGAGCLPTRRLCELAVMPNVHVVLSEILPWTGSQGFAHAFGALLAAFGAGRLLFGSGYPMVRPGRLVRELAAYRFPGELVARFPRWDAAAVAAVLGGNAARLYRIPLPTALPTAPVPSVAAGA
ncbi:amidohydrolase family protein [Pseudonocardia lacus]|uniref:amidohydrolase family protein n=1 Tax=Pseudonocardia lacus TaxID=2835865 RepID=UPI001BDCA609|nr:amidohydrolase family protein [Pseudonocardia lacus]